MLKLNQGHTIVVRGIAAKNFGGWLVIFGDGVAKSQNIVHSRSLNISILNC